jgi:Ca-activated chloride channel homolog
VRIPIRVAPYTSLLRIDRDRASNSLEADGLYTRSGVRVESVPLLLTRLSNEATNPSAKGVRTMLISRRRKSGLRSSATVLSILMMFSSLLLCVTSGSAKGARTGSKLIGSARTQSKATSEPRLSQQDQKQQDQKEEGAIKLTSRLVLVPVSASDSAGHPVKDLKLQDIVIEEEGKPQQVVSFGEAGKTPVDLALLFDISGSTHKQFTFEQQAAVRFVREDFKPSDALSLFSIGLTPKMTKARTTSVDEAIAGLMSISPMNEPTAFFDSVIDAVNYLSTTAGSGSRCVILVISDGEENYSKHAALSDVLRELQRNDCLFYSINPNGEFVEMNKISREGQGYMEAMASQTGGKAFSVSKTEALEDVFSQISAELHAQYLFGYYTDEQTPGFKRITVRAPNRPDLRIRARQGYYVGRSAGE